VTLHLFRYAVGKFSRRIPRSFTLGFLGDVIAKVAFLFLIFNAFPSVIDLVGAG